MGLRGCLDQDARRPWVAFNAGFRPRSREWHRRCRRPASSMPSAPITGPVTLEHAFTPRTTTPTMSFDIGPIVAVGDATVLVHEAVPGGAVTVQTTVRSSVAMRRRAAITSIHAVGVGPPRSMVSHRGRRDVVVVIMPCGPSVMPMWTPSTASQPIVEHRSIHAMVNMSHRQFGRLEPAGHGLALAVVDGASTIVGTRVRSVTSAKHGTAEGVLNLAAVDR